MEKKQRIHVFFSGQVQGVGFRFTTERIANNLDLEGFVRNLSDGRVEVVCEGRTSSLKDFLDDLNNAMDAYISDFQIEWSDATNEFSGFEIKIL